MNELMSLWERIKFWIIWRTRVPLGAKVFIGKPLDGKPPRFRGTFCRETKKITLYATRISDEELLTVLNHEVLHSVLYERINWETCRALDVVLRWRGEYLVFEVLR